MRPCDRIRVRYRPSTSTWAHRLVTALRALGLDAYLDDEVISDRGIVRRPGENPFILDFFNFQPLEDSTFVVRVFADHFYITWVTMDSALLATWDDERRYRFMFHDRKRAFVGMWGLPGFSPADAGVTPGAAAGRIGHLVRMATAQTYEDLPTLLPTLPFATQAYAAWAEGERQQTLVRCTGDYDPDELRAEALDAYDRALALDPDNAVYWVSRSGALGNLSRWGEALESCEHALDLIPNFAHAWYHEGVALRQLGRKDDALAAFNRALVFNTLLDAAWRDQIQLLAEFGHHAQAEAARHQRDIALVGRI